MKKYIISGIALSISCLFIFAPVVDSPKLKTIKNSVPTSEIKEISPTIPIITKTIIPSDSTEQAITYPTFDELQMKYIQIRKSSDLYMIFVQQKSLYPDKFTPENIEESFAYVNNYFDTTKPDYDFASLKQSFTW